MTRREIDPCDLPIKVKKLEPSRYGHTDSVFIADDKFVVKVYEFASLSQVKEEMRILSLTSFTPKVLSDIFFIDSRPSMIFEKLKGEVLKVPKALHVKQIAKFLRDLHTLNLSTSNPKIFEKERLKTMLLKSGDEFLLREFGDLRIDLNCDGLIHGDLFLDNVLFEDGKLSGVIDFVDSCEGDFRFDLAVVAFSWDLSEDLIDLLLKSYGLDIEKDEFKEYMKYALLYYCASRAVAGRDYSDLKIKLKRLK